MSAKRERSEASEYWRDVKEYDRGQRQLRGAANKQRVQELVDRGLVTAAWFAPTVVRIRRVDRPAVTADFWPTTERWKGPRMRRAMQGWVKMINYLGIKTEAAS